MLIRHDIPSEKYLADETAYPAVFPLFNNGKMKESVATLINGKWAVTAAHCAVDLYKKDFENHPFSVQIGGRENIIVQVIAPEQVGSAKPIRDGSGKVKKVKVIVQDLSYDIALLKLKNEVKHILPIPLYQHRDEVGKSIIVCGWGDFGTGDKGTPRFKLVNDDKFRIAMNRITKTDGNYLFFEFDNPNSKDALPLEGVNGPGDSGSPALVNTNGETQGFAGGGSGDFLEQAQLIGVSSGGRYKNIFRNLFSRKGCYGWQEYYIRISKMKAWIDQVISENS
ncbi:MAG: trypsin-like serine protease [Chroococcidiopsidaceae cyanobacterium CP_BM_ER_R8_30]|nr:trypsin-like serine protease [Chroococcidiopsidaceae cyanobacterium CP_BM_ER_R8_30]